MIGVQIVVLHVALLHRPPFGAQHSLHKPFEGAGQLDFEVLRPFRFWQWRARQPYWQFLMSYTVVLIVLQLLVGSTSFYTQIQGFVALGVEAILPIPQIIENHRSRSTKGFRLSVLANWLIGDVFKMSYFFLSEGDVPLAFKLCGLFQAACDSYLGVQYWMYGDGEIAGAGRQLETSNRPTAVTSSPRTVVVEPFGISQRLSRASRANKAINVQSQEVPLTRETGTRRLSAVMTEDHDIFDLAEWGDLQQTWPPYNVTSMSNTGFYGIGNGASPGIVQSYTRAYNLGEFFCAVDGYPCRRWRLPWMAGLPDSGWIVTPRTCNTT
nr:pq-loop repeat-containing protein 1 [Quercus suber]